MSFEFDKDYYFADDAYTVKRCQLSHVVTTVRKDVTKVIHYFETKEGGLIRSFTDNQEKLYSTYQEAHKAMKALAE